MNMWRDGRLQLVLDLSAVCSTARSACFLDGTHDRHRHHACHRGWSLVGGDSSAQLFHDCRNNHDLAHASRSKQLCMVSSSSRTWCGSDTYYPKSSTSSRASTTPAPIPPTTSRIGPNTRLGGPIIAASCFQQPPPPTPNTSFATSRPHPPHFATDLRQPEADTNLGANAATTGTPNITDCNDNA